MRNLPSTTAAPLTRSDGEGPRNDQPANEIDRQKRSLIRGLAGQVVDAPGDVDQESVESEILRLEAARSAAREAEENLRTALGPWEESGELGQSDDLPRGYKIRKWSRRNMLDNWPIFEIRAQVVGRDRRSDPEVRGYKTIGRYLTFEHADLSVVMAVADLVARLHGYRMADSTEAEILPAPTPQPVRAFAPPPKLLPPAVEVFEPAAQQVGVPAESRPTSIQDTLAALEALY